MEPVAGPPPSPLGASSFDELADRLRALRAWSGVSIRTTHERVVRIYTGNRTASPGFETVRRCFGSSRTRRGADLVADIAWVLLGDRLQSLEWRQAYVAIESGAGHETVARVDDDFPAETDNFVGRAAELTELVAGVRRAAGGPATVTIRGMPGMGKTALAVHLARRLAGPGTRRLSVNLRGYDPGNPPADPAAVLDGFLRALGVSGHRFAGATLTTRQALLYDTLRGRPSVVLLDNARSLDQVSPLVPDVPGCTVLVTSRHLLDLSATIAMRLDELAPQDALELLRARLGAQLVDENIVVATEIAELAAQHPLALAIIAGRIREHPDVRLAAHRDWLLDDRERGRFEVGMDLAFRSSYQQFPPAGARLLRLLSLHPCRDVDGFAATALSGMTPSEATAALSDLAAGSMLEPRPAGRYLLHDLVRAFATEEVLRNEPPPERDAAIDRMLAYYRCAAARAMDAYSPQDASRRPRIDEDGVQVPEFADRDAARRWLDAEYANLIDVAVHSGDRRAVDLSATLFAYLDDAAHHRDAYRLHTFAETVAEGTDRGRVLVNLGAAASQLGRYEDAIAYYERALVIHGEHGDRIGEGRAHGNLGIANAQLGRHLDAIEHLERAVSIHREVGNRTNEAIASGNLSQLFQLIGRYDEARAFGHHHLKVAREIGHRLAEGVALGNLGNIERCEGRYSQALDLHRQALTIARATGHHGNQAANVNDIASDLRLLGRLEDAVRAYREALALATERGNLKQLGRAHEGLGRCLLESAEPDEARRELTEALRIYTELGIPDAQSVSELLG